MIITIDGPAGTGKTTAARLLAEKLGIIYFDTGALYRAFTWYYLEYRGQIVDVERVVSLLPEFDLHIKRDATSGLFSYIIDQKEVTTDIRTPQVSSKVSEIAAIAQVREALIPLQRAFAKDNSVVIEGRDTGSVIFPQADWKFFLTASLAVRAQRRFLEYQSQGVECEYDEVERNIANRDHLDSSREVAPLICPEKAHVIETDDRTSQEVVEAMLTLIKAG